MPCIWCTVLFLILTVAGLSNAESFPLTDGAALDSLFTDAVRTGLESSPAKPVFANRSARLDAPASLRTIAEAAVSGAGFFLAGAEGESDCGIAVSISDIRRTIVRRSGSFDRRLALTLHITCADRNGTVILARRIEREYSDRLSRKQLDPTGAAGAFSGISGERVMIGPPGKLRIASFAILAATLGFFALR